MEDLPFYFMGERVGSVRPTILSHRGEGGEWKKMYKNN